MARKKLDPLGEVTRKEFRKRGWIDDRHRDGSKGVRAKEERRFEGKTK